MYFFLWAVLFLSKDTAVSCTAWTGEVWAKCKHTAAVVRARYLLCEYTHDVAMYARYIYTTVCRSEARLKTSCLLRLLRC